MVDGVKCEVCGEELEKRHGAPSIWGLSQDERNEQERS